MHLDNCSIQKGVAAGILLIWECWLGKTKWLRASSTLELLLIIPLAIVVAKVTEKFKKKETPNA